VIVGAKAGVLSYGAPSLIFPRPRRERIAIPRWTSLDAEVVVANGTLAEIGFKRGLRRGKARLRIGQACGARSTIGLAEESLAVACLH